MYVWIWGTTLSIHVTTWISPPPRSLREKTTCLWEASDSAETILKSIVRLGCKIEPGRPVTTSSPQSTGTFCHMIHNINHVLSVAKLDKDSEVKSKKIFIPESETSFALKFWYDRTKYLVLFYHRANKFHQWFLFSFVQGFSLNLLRGSQ